MKGDIMSEAPCRTCGSAHVARIPIHRQTNSSHSESPPTKRVCRNPDCPTNTGQASMTDTV